MDSEETAVSLTLDRFSDEHYQEVYSLIDQLPKNCSGDDDSYAAARERSLERCIYILDLYQEQPHLLDPRIPAIVEKLVSLVRSSSMDGNRRLLFQCFHYFRLLIKVRGYKAFSPFFPHDYSELVPVLRMLEECNETKDCEMADICIAEYVLLIWMSMLCKIPFDFSRYDYGSGDAASVGATTSKRIYNAVKRCLYTKDQRREAAAYCMSIFVARPDSVRQFLQPLIFDEILHFFDRASASYGDIENQYGIGLDFIISAHCLLLACLLKHVQREKIPYDWSKRILENVLSYPTVLGESSNILIRKLTTKMVVRTSLTMLRPRLASWRYNRGSRSLSSSLAQSKSHEHSDNTTIIPSADTEMEEHFEIPNELEAVINYLLTALRDKDTVCRWSVAKGFGRLCARLPYSLADQIVSAILEFFRDAFADSSRHGASLALAELGRRGLLLPSRLSEVVPIIVEALTYDEQRGTYSVGSNVRDAACYVCWSFARAYAHTELRPYNLQLAVGLLTTAVYDREVNCRRAASAAFQEHVGRQKGEFPHGIDLLTAVDYFAVGNRKRCYRELSSVVAKYPEYTRPMIDHLIQRKISHWDEEIRHLAGDALRVLSSIAPDYIASNIVPILLNIIGGHELFACHGAVIGLGRSVPVLSSHLSTSIMQQVFEIPEQLIKGRLYKGIGGELLRRGLNDYIYNCSSVLNTVSDDDARRKYIGVYKSILDENLIRQTEDIRRGAYKAAKVLFDIMPTSSESIVDMCVQKMEKATYERERIGGCLSLAALPPSILIRYRHQVLDTLYRFSIVDEKSRGPDLLWATSRRDCLFSLTEIVDKLGIGDEDGLSTNEIERVIDCYSKALDDYTLDSRGDIGSVVREAAIAGLKALFSQILSSKSKSVTLAIGLSKGAISKILQQCCEKIDRTRELACGCMESLLRQAGTAEELSAVFQISQSHILFEVFMNGQVDWAKANQAYPKLINLLNAGDEFVYSVLLGFSVTVGGMTESTARASSDALLGYLSRIQHDLDQLRQIVSTLLSIFDDHRKLDRVTLPLMKTMEQIFTYNYLDDFLINSDNEDLLGRLLDVCITETRLSKNSHKILIGLSACNCFLRYEGTELARKALKYSLAKLLHPYPRIRREAASRLYESVLSYLSLDNHSEQALSLLSETNWDNDPKDLEPIEKELEFILKVN